MKVLIINQNATNKGDRAVLLFLLRELLRNDVQQITVCTNNPDLWHDCPDVDHDKVRFIPQSWYLSVGRTPTIFARGRRRIRRLFYEHLVDRMVRRAVLGGLGARCWGAICRWLNTAFFRAAEEADCILSTGGHHLTTIVKPDARCAQTFDMSLALLADRPLILWSQSIGPFHFRRRASARQIEKILLSAARIYIRDEGSAGELMAMGVDPELVFRTSDSAFGLREWIADPASIAPSKRPAILGIAVYHATHLARAEYVEAFATLVRHAVDVGYRVRLFPMEIGGGDAGIIRDIIASSGCREACAVVDVYTPISMHLKAVAECRAFVGHKTHSVIFALTAAVPIVAIAYHQKAVDFMNAFGLGEYCIRDDALNGPRLVDLFEQINANLDGIGQQELQAAAERSRRIRDDLAQLTRDVATMQ